MNVVSVKVTVHPVPAVFMIVPAIVPMVMNGIWVTAGVTVQMHLTVLISPAWTATVATVWMNVVSVKVTVHPAPVVPMMNLLVTMVAAYQAHGNVMCTGVTVLTVKMKPTVLLLHVKSRVV